jgi:hypothetical protein
LFLEVPHYPKKHWSDNIGWAMAEVMKNIIFMKVV